MHLDSVARQGRKRPRSSPGVCVWDPFGFKAGKVKEGVRGMYRKHSVAFNQGSFSYNTGKVSTCAYNHTLIIFPRGLVLLLVCLIKFCCWSYLKERTG